MSDDPSPQFGDDDEFADSDGGTPLDAHEIREVEQDLGDLLEFDATFRPEGYRGVAVWCHDCAEEHYYPWDMLRENLTALIETGETPVHEPAFAPQPERYVPWDYARGYVDALRDTGVSERLRLDACSACGRQLIDELREASFCPRCGAQLITQRLAAELTSQGWSEQDLQHLLRRIGIAT